MGGKWKCWTNTAYIRTKEHAEPVHQPESGSYVDQATDNVNDGASSIVPKGGRALKNQAQRGFKKFRERGKEGDEASRPGATGSEEAQQGSESALQRTGRETGQAQARQTTKRATAQSPQNTALRFTGNTTQQSTKAAETAGKTIKQSTWGTIKTLQKPVKYTESATKTTIKTSRKASKAAVQTVRASQRAAQAARVSARIATTTAKAVMAAVKAAIAAVKSIVSLIAAGGWVAVVIILIIMLATMLICSPFGAFLNGGGKDMPTLSSAIQAIDNEFDQKIAGIEAQSGPVNKVVFVPAHPDPNKSHVTN
jgi:hypothetical protein